jgi:hypothetical protein
MVVVGDSVASVAVGSGGGGGCSSPTGAAAISVGTGKVGAAVVTGVVAAVAPGELGAAVVTRVVAPVVAAGDANVPGGASLSTDEGAGARVVLGARGTVDGELVDVDWRPAASTR